MHCPHFVDERRTGTVSQCVGSAMAFEPSTVDQRDFCRSGRYRHCPLYRQACRSLVLEIHREVARAVG
jgi:hypothetical protein